MNFIRNNSGIALITSLMFTLISFTIIMVLMYMMLSGTRQNSATKRYHTALQATYGANDLFVKDLLPQILQNTASATLITDLQTAFSAVNLSISATSACLQDKLTKATGDWNVACNNGLDASSFPDMQFDLQSTTNSPYTVYSKIVDTSNGNTDLSGLQLEGGGVAQAQQTINPQHFPFVYRIEIQGQRKTAAVEKAKISVLYAY